jgi:hypothetical protein
VRGYTILWRNLGLFVLSLGLALWYAWSQGIPGHAAIIVYTLGVWPCWAIAKLGWDE